MRLAGVAGNVIENAPTKAAVPVLSTPKPVLWAKLVFISVAPIQKATSGAQAMMLSKPWKFSEGDVVALFVFSYQWINGLATPTLLIVNNDCCPNWQVKPGGLVCVGTPGELMDEVA